MLQGVSATEGDKKPTIIAFVNKKSGGQRGKEVCFMIRRSHCIQYVGDISLANIFAFKLMVFR
jgi:hypothetical protein